MASLIDKSKQKPLIKIIEKQNKSTKNFKQRVHYASNQRPIDTTSDNHNKQMNYFTFCECHFERDYQLWMRLLYVRNLN